MLFLQKTITFLQRDSLASRMLITVPLQQKGRNTLIKAHTLQCQPRFLYLRWGNRLLAQDHQ